METGDSGANTNGRSTRHKNEPDVPLCKTHTPFNFV